MRNRFAWVAGALGAAGVAYRALRQRSTATPVDPRAEQLRQKLEESKAIGDDRAQFESGETAVDEVDPSVDEKRAAAHELGRAAAERMRSPKAEG